MTLTELIQEARSKSRVSDFSDPDATVVRYINEGIKEFAKRVHGFAKSTTLTIGTTGQTTLPTDFRDVIAVSHDNHHLQEASFNLFHDRDTSVTGGPAYYSILEDVIKVHPFPTQDESIELLYFGSGTLFPTSYTGDETQAELAPDYDLALAYYAAAGLAENQHEEANMYRFMRKFDDIADQYWVDRANDDSKLYFKRKAIGGLVSGKYPFSGTVTLS